MDSDKANEIKARIYNNADTKSFYLTRFREIFFSNLLMDFEKSPTLMLYLVASKVSIQVILIRQLK